jgi:predicted DNA-binding transcriptional regulator AlpA
VTRKTYNAKELADELGVSVSSIYQSVKDGDCPVPPIKVGRRLVWPKATVDRLLEISGAS